MDDSSDMESTRLIVVDATPDATEALNSLLRNSGLNVHVLFTDSVTQMDRMVREQAPVMLLFRASPANPVPLRTCCELADSAGLLLAVQCVDDQREALFRAMEHLPCLAVSDHLDDGFVALVQRLSATAAPAGEVADDAQTRFELLLDSIDEPVAYLHEGLHVHANRAYRQALGLDAGQELQSLSLLDVARSQDHDLKRLLRELSQGDLPGLAVTAGFGRDPGQEFAAELSFTPAPFHGERCVQLRVRRLDDLAGLQAELSELRATEPLTGLPSRDAFLERLQEAMSEDRGGASLALLYIEPDEWRTMEGALGLTELDASMTALAEVIRECSAPEDRLSRYSDHAFAVLAIRANRRLLTEFSRDLQQALAARLTETGPPAAAGACSIGLTLIGPQTGDASEALAQARRAWEDARGEGSSVVRFTPDRLPAGDDEESDWRQRIAFALNNDEFYSVRQTIEYLDGDGEGLFENRTLLHEDAGDLPPETFLPPAERLGLASAIDRQVIPGLLRAMAGGGDRHIINISADSVQDFSFASWFQHQLEKYGVEGTQVILQAPLAAVTRQPRAAERLFEELRSSGCGFSVSGFDGREGAEDLLRRLDLTLVKLPHGLARDIALDAGRQATVRKVVQAADSRQVLVLADEVNDSTAMATLWQCGVKLVCGAFLQESPRAASSQAE